MKKFFTVSDIHSFFRELEFALREKKFEIDNPDHYLIICGDAFDRGDESVRIFELLKLLSSQGRLIYVRGNHEDLLFSLVDNIRSGKYIGSHHMSNGTLSTVCQISGFSVYDVLGGCYDKSIFESKIGELLEFINTTCVDYYQLGYTIFTHGWLPTTSAEDGTTIVSTDWRNGNWEEARWENGQEMFKFGINPPDISTVVCGHWHTSWGWCNIKKQCTQFGDDACFDTFMHETNGKKIVALDACTAYTRDINVVIFDESGGIIEE